MEGLEIRCPNHTGNISFVIFENSKANQKRLEENQKEACFFYLLYFLVYFTLFSICFLFFYSNSNYGCALLCGSRGVAKAMHASYNDGYVNHLFEYDFQVLIHKVKR